MKTIMFLLLMQFYCIYAFCQSTQQSNKTLHSNMDKLVDAYNKQNLFNGTVLVAQKGRVLFKGAYGYRDAKKNVPHDVKDAFQIGSITKQITAAVIMQLQQEGKLSVHDKLSKYYPAYPNGDKISIEALLTHTSGIYEYVNDSNKAHIDATQHFTEEQLLALFKDHPLDFEPGTKYNYSNSGYILLGYIIQKVTKNSFYQEVNTRIFQPQGMNHSGFDFAGLEGSYKSKGYYVLNRDSIVDAPIVDSTISFSTGSVYSTVEDLYKWERAIATGKILTSASWNAVFTPHLGKYGYGWEIDTAYGKLVTSHGGIIFGFSSYILRIPQDEVVIITLDNASSVSLGSMAFDLASIVYHLPYTVPSERQAISLSAISLQEYEGEYEYKGNGNSPLQVRITIAGDHLKAHPTGSGNKPVEFYAKKKDWFYIKGKNVEAEFIRDANGQIIEHIIHMPPSTFHYKKMK